jgi:hypothetical protein
MWKEKVIKIRKPLQSWLMSPRMFHTIAHKTIFLWIIFLWINFLSFTLLWLSFCARTTRASIWAWTWALVIF